MNEALSKQEALLNMVSRALENFKKVRRLNYSAAKIHSRISSLKETWSQCIQGHAALMQIYPEAKRANLAYFQEDQLDEHEEIYQMTLDFMTEWLEELESLVSPNRSVQTEQSFSRTESALSLRHLPLIKMPLFSGNFAEWESFCDQFTALIIERISLISRECISSQQVWPGRLVKSFPVFP